MTPDEDHLRRALRDGDEQNPPDADRLIAAARADRHSRRVRLAGIGLAAVAVLAVAGVVSAVAVGHSSSPTAAGSGASASDPDPSFSGSLPAGPVASSSAPAGSQNSAGSGTSTGPSSVLPRPATYDDCPKTAPSVPTAGPGGTVLPADASSLTICVYGNGSPLGAVVGGDPAHTLISGLNALASGAVAHNDLCTADGGATVVVTADAVTAVGNTGGCGRIVGPNGSAQARGILAELVSLVTSAH